MIAIGLRANTSMKPTSGFAMELGYLVTLVKKATAAFGTDRTHAANELNGPNFARAILTTEELMARQPQGRGARLQVAAAGSLS